MYSTVDSLVRRSTLILENLDSLDNSIGSFDTNIHYKYTLQILYYWYKDIKEKQIMLTQIIAVQRFVSCSYMPMQEFTW